MGNPKLPTSCVNIVTSILTTFHKTQLPTAREKYQTIGNYDGLESRDGNPTAILPGSYLCCPTHAIIISFLLLVVN